MQTKFDLVNKMLSGRLPSQLAMRRDRGDTFLDIAFWLRTVHGIEVSQETVRQWCQPAQDSVEATG